MFCALAALLLTQATPEPQTASDSIALKGGKLWTGTLLRADAEEVELLDVQGELRVFPRTKVKAMAGPRAEYAEFRAGLRQAYSDRSSAEEVFAFAAWCRAHGYARDEALALWRVLALDETHVEAHRALGHQARGEVWLVPLGKEEQLAIWSDLLRQRAQVEQPWRFTTMHFAVTISGPLDRAVIAAAAAEYYYGELYALLQEPARLWDLRRPIEVRVWPAKTRGYPQADGRLDGHRDSLTRVLHTWLESTEGGIERPVSYERLLAEAVLHSVAEERTRGASEVPAWLRSGAGTLLEAGSQWGSGLPACDPRLPAQLWVDRHAALPAPRTAANLAATASAEFLGPRAEAARAQAYTLLHFLLFSEPPAYVAEFSAYAQLAMRNLGGGSAFSGSFGRRLRALEKEWPERVQRLGKPTPGARE